MEVEDALEINVSNLSLFFNEINENIDSFLFSCLDFVSVLEVDGIFTFWNFGFRNGGRGLYPGGGHIGAGLLPKPIRGVNSNSAGI